MKIITQLLLLLVATSSMAQVTISEAGATDIEPILSQEVNHIGYYGNYEITSSKKRNPDLDYRILNKGLADNKIKQYNNAQGLEKLLFTFIDMEEVDIILSQSYFNFYCLTDTKPIVAVTSGFGPNVKDNSQVEQFRKLEKEGTQDNQFVIWVHLTRTLKEGVTIDNNFDFDRGIDHTAPLPVSIKYLTPKNYDKLITDAITWK